MNHPHLVAARTPMVAPHDHDPEMLYVECGRCGRPVLWEAGRTTAMLARSGVEMDLLDDHCLIVSAGCPACMPDQNHFETRVVRLRETLLTNPLIFGGEGGHA
ncbi:MAG: hypothetical protein AB7E47_07010 [Desulfovibrionaceae bacterium]